MVEISKKIEGFKKSRLIANGQINNRDPMKNPEADPELIEQAQQGAVLQC